MRLPLLHQWQPHQWLDLHPLLISQKSCFCSQFELLSVSKPHIQPTLVIVMIIVSLFVYLTKPSSSLEICWHQLDTSWHWKNYNMTLLANNFSHLPPGRINKQNTQTYKFDVAVQVYDFHFDCNSFIHEDHHCCLLWRRRISKLMKLFVEFMQKFVSSR